MIRVRVARCARMLGAAHHPPKGSVMWLFLKYIVKNIAEKKLRTALILVSIMSSAALFFASSSLTDTMIDMYETLLRTQVGSATFVVRPGPRSAASALRIDTAPVEGVAFTAGEVSMSGSYTPPEPASAFARDQKQLSVRGLDLGELQRFNPVVFRERSGDSDFAGNRIIVAAPFADEAGLNAGETIDIEIQGARRKLTIWGVAYPTGLFREMPQAETRTVVVPRDYAARLSGMRGSVNAAYVVLAPGADAASTRRALEDRYRRYEVTEAVSTDELRAALANMTIPFYLMTSMVLFISIFIIYSTFKVITVERLPVIGTFRSIGADRKMTTRLLTAESAAYGVIGGILGTAAGIGILYLMATVIASDPWGGRLDVQVQFGPGNLIASFALAVFVAVVSARIPIARVARIPVKELVLNLVGVRGWKKRWKSAVGLALIAAGQLIPLFSPQAIGLPAAVIGMFATVFGIIFTVPLATALFLRVFERAYPVIFGNIGTIAAKNLRDNKSVLNNITLLTIGIMALLMINTISYSVGIEVLDAYRDWQFDIRTSIPAADRSTEQSLRAVPGVARTYAAGEHFGGIEVVGHDYRLAYLQGVDPTGYLDFMRFRPVGAPAGSVNPGASPTGGDGLEASTGALARNHPADALLATLNDGRTILVSSFLRDTLGLRAGGDLTLDMPAGHRTYRIGGFYDSLMMNGSNAMIHRQYFRTDMQRAHADTFFVQVAPEADAEEVLAGIRRAFRERGVWGQTVAAMEQANTQQNNQMFSILTAFSVLAMAIGIFGVFNNYAISFIERRRSLAILKSVGMSRAQVRRMIFVEALTGGLIAGAVGVAAGLLMLAGAGFTMQAISLPIRIHLSTAYLLIALAGGIAVSLPASLGPALRSSRLNIIEAIKYE